MIYKNISERLNWNIILLNLGLLGLIESNPTNYKWNKHTYVFSLFNYIIYVNLVWRISLVDREVNSLFIYLFVHFHFSNSIGWDEKELKLHNKSERP